MQLALSQMVSFDFAGRLKVSMLTAVCYTGSLKTPHRSFMVDSNQSELLCPSVKVNNVYGCVCV